MIVPLLADLIKVSAHLGHPVRRWNPKMAPYILIEKHGVHIIDLVQTSHLLKLACDFVYEASQKGKKFLFIGTKQHMSSIVCHEAEKCGASYVNQRWLGGTLTNWATIKTRIDRLKKLEQMENDKSELSHLSKKEIASFRRELEKLQRNLNGIKNMLTLPDLVIILDQKRESTALQECIKLHIPVISIVDTNGNPELTDVLIPANDDSTRSIQLILSRLADCICK